MKREITYYETNNLDTLKFIRMCKNFNRIYKGHKKMLLDEVAKEIWRMIQQDVFNVANSELYFNNLINDIEYDDFIVLMYILCYAVEKNEEDYIYYRDFEDKDCISLIGEPIYKFMHDIEELIPYED